VHQNNVGGFSPYVDKDKGQAVMVDVEEKIFFANFGKFEMVERGYQELQDKCPTGQVVGVSVRYLTSLGFFSWTEKFRMQGTCVNM
jgi:hypothetical protein